MEDVRKLFQKKEIEEVNRTGQKQNGIRANI